MSVGIFKTKAGYTVQIPNGTEVYDAESGQLVRVAHFTEEEFRNFSKPITDKRPAITDGRAGWINAQTLPAALRDLVVLGDSELDYDHLSDDRPAALAALDKAAEELGDDGPPVTSASGTNLFPAPAPEPEHPAGAPTAAAASLAAHQSPAGARNAVSPGDAQKAFETAESARSAVNQTDTAVTATEDEAVARAAAREKAKETEAARSVRPK